VSADLLVLRPLREADLPVLAQLGGRDASGWNWSGHRSTAALRRRLDEDGYLGEQDGWLVAAAGDGPCLASVGWRFGRWHDLQMVSRLRSEWAR
jgi:hypothetical protein